MYLLPLVPKVILVENNSFVTNHLNSSPSEKQAIQNSTKKKCNPHF
jgi:hypothetical protein